MSSAQALASKAPDTSLARLNRLLSSPRSQGLPPQEASPSPTRYLQAFACPHSPAPQQGTASVPPGTTTTSVPPGGSGEARASLRDPEGLDGCETVEAVQDAGHLTTGRDSGCLGVPHGEAPKGVPSGSGVPGVPLGASGVVPTPHESSRVPARRSLPGEATEGSVPGPARKRPDSHNRELRIDNVDAESEGNAGRDRGGGRNPRRVPEEESAEKCHQDGATSELRIEPMPEAPESAAHPPPLPSAQSRLDSTQSHGRVQNPSQRNGAAGPGRAKRRREEDAAQAAAEREHSKWLRDLREFACGKPAVAGSRPVTRGREQPDALLHRVGSSASVGHADKEGELQVRAFLCCSRLG